MDPEGNTDYSRWKMDELRKAEATAERFLEDNAQQISETMRAKMRFLEILVNRLSQQQTTLDGRLDAFARVSEIAQLLKDDADGFFELASQPVVAKILSNVRTKRKRS